MNVIFITSVNKLPELSRGPLTESEIKMFKDMDITVYQLAHMYPKPYNEYFVEA